MQRLVKIDGKVRTDTNYPAGFMDVVSIEKTNEHFRLLYDTKGRFIVHRITPEEGKYKLCKITKTYLGKKGIPLATTHDGRTIRYPDPLVKANDTVRFNLDTGKITEHLKFDVGSLAMITGGKNLGRIGIVESKEKHEGSFDIVHIKDATGNKFATRSTNVFIIGKNLTSHLISLPQGKGIRLSIIQERDRKFKKTGSERISEKVSEKVSEKISQKSKEKPKAKPKKKITAPKKPAVPKKPVAKKD